MKVSYEWLQSYFKDQLPAPEQLTELFTFHLAEIESVEKVDADTVFDIKILPDRACYALSVRGIARELAAILDMPIQEEEIPAVAEASIPDPDIKIAEPELCTKFVSRRIEGIQIGVSPEWMQRRLKAIGQRPINNIVDATNYIMFGLGRPMHAFDADKVKGAIMVRAAKPGEILVTLDNKRVELAGTELVVADDEGPLGLAGIKGGKRAEVDENTKNIILESANWNSTNIRRTAVATGIRTEASKRFENRTPPLLAEEGVLHITPLIMSIASTEATKAGRVHSVSFEEVVHDRTIVVDPEEVSRKLGIPLEEKTVGDVLLRLRIKSEKHSQGLLLRIPNDRLDLEMTDDIVEEVGRILGYDQIPLVLPPQPPAPLGILKPFYWEWKVREILLREGFSEIMTSSFSSTGEIAIEKPLAKDKSFCRPNLRVSFAPALAMNFLNAPLFGLDEVRLFEIGRVFPKSGERAALAIGCAGPKKDILPALDVIAKKLAAELGIAFPGETTDGIFECDLDAVIATLPEPKSWDISIPESRSEKFTPFSRYPFVVRDIAIFVPQETDAAAVLSAIRTAAGELGVRAWKFDEFEKDGKQSLAFRIIFQSFERTLTDDEVNLLMEKVAAALVKAFGAEVR